MRRLRAFAAVALSLGLVLAPRLAEACAVCSAGREDENRAAFLWTTLILSVLPLGMLGGAIWLLVRRARTLDERRPGVLAAAPPAGVTRAPSSP